MIYIYYILNALYGRYDHMERLTAQEAQAHPYFDEVRRRDPQIIATDVPSDGAIPIGSSSSSAGGGTRSLWHVNAFIHCIYNEKNSIHPLNPCSLLLLLLLLLL